jgi:hypothetical protein
LSAARLFGSVAANRSLDGLFFAGDFNGLGMVFHILRSRRRQRIGSPDYATDELKK